MRNRKDEFNAIQQYGNDEGKKYQNMNYRKSSLRILHLARSKITDLSFFKITYLINLTEIHLQWCHGLSDIGIESLVKGCLKLEIIDLKSCGISDLSIFSIVKYSKELKVLDLSWCSNITDSGIQGLLVNQSDRLVPDPPYVMSPLPRRRRGMLNVDSLELITATSIPTSSILVSTEQFSILDGTRTMMSNTVTSVIDSETSLLIEEMIEGSNLDPFVESTVNVADVVNEGIVHGIASSQSCANDSNIVNNGSHYINYGNNVNNNSRSNSDSNSDGYNHVNSRSRNGNVQNINDSRNDPRMVFDIISEPVYVSKLETLSVVWCLHLTDGALLSLAGLPNLKNIDATGCTGINQENITILKEMGINLKLWYDYQC